jgi:hypothetical protein
MLNLLLSLLQKQQHIFAKHSWKIEMIGKKMLGISMKGKKVLNIIAILRTLTNNSTYTPT